MIAEKAGVSIDHQDKFLSKGRQLDHKIPDDERLTGADNTRRAGKTSTGFCIQYRETLFEHFDRIGSLFEKEPPLLTHMEIGMDRGLKMYGMGMQGSKGNQTIEKPSFVDVVGVMKWEAWEDYRDIDKVFVQKIFIVFASKLLEDEGLG